MTETKPYSFISVTSAEDDEVIQAGVGAPGTTKTEDKNLDENVVPKSDEQPRSATRAQAATPVVAQDQASAVESSAAVQENSSEAETKQPPVQPASTVVSNQSNEPVPFAHMQKVILIVLAVFVLAFIIYYNLSIR